MISWLVCRCWKEINLFSIVFLLGERNETSNGEVGLYLNIETGTWMHLQEVDKMENYTSNLSANLNMSIAKLSYDKDCDEFISLECAEKDNPSEYFSFLMYCSSNNGGGFKYQNSCYHIITVAKTWEEAEQHCIDNYDGHLVTILDKAEDFYLQYLLQSNNAEVLIGIKIQDRFQQKWTSGSYVGYNDFNETIKNFTEGTCAVKNQRKMWSTVPCSEKYSFMCEKVIPKPEIDEPFEWMRLFAGVSVFILAIVVYNCRSKYAKRVKKKKTTSIFYIQPRTLLAPETRYSELEMDDEVSDSEDTDS